MKLNRVRGMLLAVAALFLSGLIVFVIDNTAVVTVTTSPVQVEAPVLDVLAPQPAPCLNDSDPFYHANLPVSVKERPWSFGPPATVFRDWEQSGYVGSVYDRPFKPIRTIEPHTAGAELKARLCGRHSPSTIMHGGDKALYLAIASVVDGIDPNRHITRQEWRDGVEYAVGTGLQWRLGKVERRTETGDGYTLYMVPGKNKGGQPKVGASKLRPVSSWYYIIPFMKRDGRITILELRLDCGFQPRVPNPKQLPASLRATL